VGVLCHETAIFGGIVFLMTVTPDWELSLLGIAVATDAGILIAAATVVREPSREQETLCFK